MTAPHVWHLWPSRYWPASAAEETRFHSDLVALSERATRGPVGPVAPADRSSGHRSHVTAVLNALRSGMEATALLEQIPGTAPQSLLEAYEDLEARREASEHAWDAIVRTPRLAAHRATLASARELLPVPLHRIATRVAGGGTAAAAVATIAAQVQRHRRAVHGVERALSGLTPPSARAVRLGLQLHNPQEPALWGSAFYLPRRVADISPTRVADLLNERNLAP